MSSSSGDDKPVEAKDDGNDGKDDGNDGKEAKKALIEKLKRMKEMLA